MTAKASGGVLNPGVATSLFAIGELNWIRYVAYICAQLSGAGLAAKLGAVADLSVSNHAQSWGFDSMGPGCVPQNDPEMYLTIFFWECVGMFILCGTVLATAVAKPGFGNLAPVAIGLSVMINISASGNVTGGAYNPARFFGPAIALGCRLNLTWLYFGAHFTGSLLAAASYRLIDENEKESDLSQKLEDISTKGEGDFALDLESPTDITQPFSNRTPTFRRSESEAKTVGARSLVELRRSTPHTRFPPRLTPQNKKYTTVNL
mmetsp:Transcript_17395/g.39270  ORF Transcript_17395/g.39270 Transcript_17395/m.39270 type:complete len:263 (+) Transcript_17395:605-1393(+)